MAPKNLALTEGHLDSAKGFRFPALSGALTVITTAQDVYGFRNASTTKPFVVSQIVMSWTTTTAFGAAQACPWGLWKVAGFTAIHSGGTGIKTIAGHRKRVSSCDLLTDVTCRMAAAVLIDTATYTAPDADEPDYVLPTTMSTTPVGSALWTPGEGCLPEVLDQDEGFIARPLVTMGATGVGNLYISIEGHVREGLR